MGLGGISIWQLAIILVIVVLIFGTKKLGTLGKDLGGAVKSFRGAMDEADKDPETKQIDEQQDAQFSEAKTEENTSDKAS